MIKILIVSSPHYSYHSHSGAFVSLRNMVDGLRRDKRFLIRILSRERREINYKNLTIVPFNSLIVNIYDKIKGILNIFGLNFYIHFLQILNEINKFRPNIIITQLDMSFATIICAKLKNIPVIYIIRDLHNFCPIYTSIKSYGKNCNGLKDRKTCYKCINNWRTLRSLLDNTGFREYSLKNLMYTILYKLRYYIVRMNYLISSKSTINVVTSSITKKFLSLGMKPEKIKVMVNNPIRRKNLLNLKKKDIENILFTVVPGVVKGGHFILRLSRIIPELSIKVIGLKTNNKNIICLDAVSHKDMNILYRESNITLVPSFWVETFGRVVIESLVNRTPVITSPNVGANEYFIGKNYVRSVPLKLGLWRKTIREMIKNPPVISDKDIEDIYKKFSVNPSVKSFIKLISGVLMYEYNKKME